jgi:RNA polymerase sigma-70 factor, ECF subfamily
MILSLNPDPGSGTINAHSLNEALLNPQTRRTAFSQVVKQFSERLYWQIRKMGISHEDADDILQNVFLKAWTNLDYFRGDAKISTWLFRITVNESITFLNQQNKTNEYKTDMDDETMLYTVAADPYFEGNELEAKFLKAIETLPPKQRAVFTMRYFEEMKYEEMSEVMGTSVGALKASYHHAAKKIEAYIIQDH